MNTTSNIIFPSTMDTLKKIALLVGQPWPTLVEQIATYFSEESFGGNNSIMLLACLIFVAFFVRHMAGLLIGFTDYFKTTVDIPSSDRYFHSALNWVSSRPYIITAGHFHLLSVQKRLWETEQTRNVAHDDYTSVFQPQKSVFFFENRLFVFRRCVTSYTNDRSSQPETYATVSCYCSSNELILKFLRATFRESAKGKETAINRVHSSGAWAPMRPSLIRSVNSVHMNDEEKESILEDVDRYLNSDSWWRYAAAGIPIRRGYLFSGPPGTGKSSFALAIAGASHLPIYLLSTEDLAREEIDLKHIMSGLPSRSLLLLEDVHRSSVLMSNPNEETKKQDVYSSLLNAIDGVGAPEGRILVMTTNDREALPADLIRPGRIDRQVTFGLASLQQAESMFRNFYEHTGQKGLEALADDFKRQISEHIVTPAAIQGYLLGHLTSPEEAASKDNIKQWLNNVLREERKSIPGDKSI